MKSTPHTGRALIIATIIEDTHGQPVELELIRSAPDIAEEPLTLRLLEEARHPQLHELSVMHDPTLGELRPEESVTQHLLEIYQTCLRARLPLEPASAEVFAGVQRQLTSAHDQIVRSGQFPQNVADIRLLVAGVPRLPGNAAEACAVPGMSELQHKICEHARFLGADAAVAEGPSAADAAITDLLGLMQADDGVASSGDLAENLLWHLEQTRQGETHPDHGETVGQALSLFTRSIQAAWPHVSSRVSQVIAETTPGAALCQVLSVQADSGVLQQMAAQGALATPALVAASLMQLREQGHPMRESLALDLRDAAQAHSPTTPQVLQEPGDRPWLLSLEAGELPVDGCLNRHMTACCAAALNAAYGLPSSAETLGDRFRQDIDSTFEEIRSALLGPDEQNQPAAASPNRILN